MNPISIYARLAVLLALVLALAAGAWKCISIGKGMERADWMAKELVASEAARLREQALQKTNERLDREYQNFKQRSAAAGRASADSLRHLDAVSASADTAAECRADDPRPAIASECRSALKQMDDYARSLAGQATGLQGYASQVCVTQ